MQETTRRGIVRQMINIVNVSTLSQNGIIFYNMIKACFFTFILFLCVVIGFRSSVHAQIDSSKMRVILLDNLVKKSTVSIRNNFPDAGKVFGISGDSEEYLRDFLEGETFSIETSDFDSLLFKYEYELFDNSILPIRYSLKVNENGKILFITPGVPEGKEFILTNSIRKLKGKKIYDIIVDDDAKPFRISVVPLPEASQFIDIVQLAQPNRYIVKLKTAEVIDPLMRKRDKDYERNGFYEIPIGVRIFDPEIPSQSYNRSLLLKMKYEAKKK